MSAFYTTLYVDAIGIHPCRRKALNAIFHNATWTRTVKMDKLPGTDELKGKRDDKKGNGLAFYTPKQIFSQR